MIPIRTRLKLPLRTFLTRPSPIDKHWTLMFQYPIFYRPVVRHQNSFELSLTVSTHFLIFSMKLPFKSKRTRIYDREPLEFADSDHDFLPLFYVVIGLGYLFSREKHQRFWMQCSSNASVSRSNSPILICFWLTSFFTRMRHFIAARGMVDISRCRNLLALQALIGFVLFLMSTARLATSHTYIGLAVTSAMRLGLSSYSIHTESMPDSERDLRRRVFYTIVKLDIYTAQVLGLPILTNIQELKDADPEQWAQDVRQLKNQSSLEAFGAIAAASSAKYLELLIIIHKMAKRVFPRPDARAAGDTRRRVLLIKTSEIMEAQRELEQWRKSIEGLFPSRA